MKNKGCFVAGTLVHTDKGLVPIEQLNVGNMVLSKHENGEGEQAYKCITRTFKSAEKKPIVAFLINDEYFRSELIFCTEDHPIWSSGEGWKPACEFDELGEGDRLELARPNTSGYFVHGYRTGESITPGIFFTFMIEDMYSHVSFVLDTREGDAPTMLYYDERPLGDDNSKPKLYGNGKSYKENNNNDGLLPSQPRVSVNLEEAQAYIKAIHSVEGAISYNYDLPPYIATVYNIEVEDYHTYYVGESGVWVHDKQDLSRAFELLSQLPDDFLPNGRE